MHCHCITPSILGILADSSLSGARVQQRGGDACKRRVFWKGTLLMVRIIDREGLIRLPRLCCMHGDTSLLLGIANYAVEG
jgi:hypothetical protein